MAGKFLLCTHFRIMMNIHNGTVKSIFVELIQTYLLKSESLVFARIAAVTTTFDTRLMDMNIVLAHF